MARALTQLETFLISDLDTQLKLVGQPGPAAEIKVWLGDRAFNELAQFGSGSAHLSAGPRNIVFVPGVMGSTLVSRGLGGVWWLDMMFARDKLESLALTKDGLGDADTDADVHPAAIDVAYVPFRRAIASSNKFGGSEELPYDWRKPLRASADALCAKIIDCYNAYEERVHLVGHSMGGLLIRTTLMLHGKELWPKVGKIVFIGTPHYGSPSIAGYLKNHLWGFEALATLGMFLSRETFRTMRGVLSLLPAPAGIYPGSREAGKGHPCANFDMYDAEAWNLKLDAPATTHLQSILDEARQLHTDLYQWHDALLQTETSRMLMIAGVGQTTLFRLELHSRAWGVWEQDKITERVDGNPDRDGDGRVPVASAGLEDVTMRYVKGVHGGLPNIPSVAMDVLAWLGDGDLKLSDTMEGALATHLSGGTESEAPLLDDSDKADRFRTLPDYEHPTPEFKASIDAKLTAGLMPEVNRARIL